MSDPVIHEIFVFSVGAIAGFLIREYLSGFKLPVTVSELRRKDSEQ